MNIVASGFLPPLHPIAFDRPGDATPGAGPADFAQWLQRSLAETNTKLIAADQQVQRLALGETDNLHQVMIALEEAKLSFQLMVQVRSRLLEGYQDLLRMQI